MRPLALLSRHAADALVLLLAALAQVEVWSVPLPGPKPIIVGGLLLATLPLLARRRFPLAASACVFAALAGMTFVHPEATASSRATGFALFLAFWSAGAHAEPRRALAGLAAGFAAIVVVIERDPTVGYPHTARHFVAGGGVLLAAVVVGGPGRRG